MMTITIISHNLRLLRVTGQHVRQHLAEEQEEDVEHEVEQGDREDDSVQDKHIISHVGEFLKNISIIGHGQLSNDQT